MLLFIDNMFPQIMSKPVLLFHKIIFHYYYPHLYRKHPWIIKHNGLKRTIQYDIVHFPFFFIYYRNCIEISEGLKLLYIFFELSLATKCDLQ